jgi:hypothetical protein
MPSIPQSLLWISLVVLWLFVLVPMLINKRDTVRRTSDVALATRVLNGKSRLTKRGGPAAGHRHDPDWQPVEEFTEDYPDLYEEPLAESSDYADQRDVIREYDEAVREARMGSRSRSVVVVAAVSEQRLIETDYLDVDVVDENSGALPVGGTGVQASLFDASQDGSTPADLDHADEVDDEVAERAAAPVTEPFAAFVDEGHDEGQVHRDQSHRDEVRRDQAHEYEYVDDTSGLEVDDEPAAPVAARSASRQRRLSATSEAAISARKYRFRKRVLIVMATLMTLTALLSFNVSPTLWWSCGAVAGVMVLYLAYLRRQTRIEEQVRRRRQQRMARSRPFIEEQRPPRRPEVDFTEFPTRLQRLGAAVLEIDDEDPVFEHLDEVPYSRRHYGRPTGLSRDELPRASGQ